MLLQYFTELLKIKKTYEEKVYRAPEHEKKQSFTEFLQSRQKQHAIISVHLGIDFGTSYTKVCFRHLETEESGFLPLLENNSLGFVESSVKIQQNRIYTPLDDEWYSISGNFEYIPYLKMSFLDNVKEENENYPEKIETLVVFFLAALLQHIRKKFIIQEEERIYNKHIRWSSSVGLPVSYYDNDCLKYFKKLVKSAWMLSEFENLPNDLHTLGNIIKQINYYNCKKHLPCIIVPELIASVFPFVYSQAAVNNLYVYIDIGGGTLDAAAFVLTENSDHEKQINLLDAEIKELGVEKLIEAYSQVICEKNGIKCRLYNYLIKYFLFHYSKKYHDTIGFDSKKSKEAIKRHIATCLVCSKKKDDYHWHEKMDELNIFLAGGGSRSQFYKKAIENVYSRVKSTGIKRFRFRELQEPTDLVLRRSNKSLFIRLSLAYGLSHPYYENPHVIGFPSVNPQLDPSKKVKSFDYEEKALDNYGEIL